MNGAQITREALLSKPYAKNGMLFWAGCVCTLTWLERTLLLSRLASIEFIADLYFPSRCAWREQAKWEAKRKVTR